MTYITVFKSWQMIFWFINILKGNTDLDWIRLLLWFRNLKTWLPRKIMKWLWWTLALPWTESNLIKNINLIEKWQTNFSALHSFLTPAWFITWYKYFACFLRRRHNNKCFLLFLSFEAILNNSFMKHFKLLLFFIQNWRLFIKNAMFKWVLPNFYEIKSKFL